MTDNVIYGVDFRAGTKEAPLLNAPDCQVIGRTGALFYVGPATLESQIRQFHPFPFSDTAPSEYVAPSDDCA